MNAAGPAFALRRGARQYNGRVEYLTAEELPDDPDQIGDGVLITADAWCRLQGVKPASFKAELSRARKRRRHDAQFPDQPKQERPGDIPEPAKRAPDLWTMSQYRAWRDERPGRYRGGRARGGTGPGAQVRLPITCPHCEKPITAEELEAREGKRLEAYAAVRASKSAAEAALLLELDDDEARRREMQWVRRQAGD